MILIISSHPKCAKWNTRAGAAGATEMGPQPRSTRARGQGYMIHKQTPSNYAQTGLYHVHPFRVI